MVRRPFAIPGVLTLNSLSPDADLPYYSGIDAIQ